MKILNITTHKLLPSDDGGAKGIYGFLKYLNQSQNKNCVVEPNNPKELAKAIIKVLKDEKLQRELEKNSGNLGKKYSWNKTAKETINLCMNVLNN